MREMENDSVCKALRKFFADVWYVTPNKVPVKQAGSNGRTDGFSTGRRWHRLQLVSHSKQATGQRGSRSLCTDAGRQRPVYMD